MICILFALLAALVSSQSGPYAVTLQDGMSVSWVVGQGSSGPMLNITVKCTSVSWVGIGWHTPSASGSDDKGMEDVDFTIAIWEAGTLQVTDRKSVPGGDGQSAPLLDTDPKIGGTDDIIYFDGTQDGSTSTFFFSKLFNTGDTKGDKLIDPSNLQHIIFAHGNSNDFGNHGKNKGDWMIDFSNGQNSPFNG